MSISRTEVRPSTIHGFGVFAKVLIKKGEKIWDWDLSKIVDQSKINLLSPEELHNLCRYDEEHFLINQAPYCYINHSCNPNTEVIGFADFARRDILPDEEITSNYNQDGNGVEFLCLCGASQCIRIVTKCL